MNKIKFALSALIIFLTGSIVFALNKADFAYKTLPNMIIQRSSACSAVLLKNGEILITGGNLKATVKQKMLSQLPDTTKTAEIYNPETGKYKRVSDMNVERYNHSSFLLNNGNVLIIGGHNRNLPNGIIPMRTAEIYDVKNDKFILKNLKIYGPNHKIYRTKDNSVVVVTPEARIQIFNEKTSEFENYKYQLPENETTDKFYRVFQTDEKEILFIPYRPDDNKNILKFVNKDLPLQTLSYTAEELNKFGKPVVMLPGNKLLSVKRDKNFTKKAQFAIYDIKTGVINNIAETDTLCGQGNGLSTAYNTVKSDDDNLYIGSVCGYLGTAWYCSMINQAYEYQKTAVYNISKNKFIPAENPKSSGFQAVKVNDNKIFLINFDNNPQMFYKKQ